MKFVLLQMGAGFGVIALEEEEYVPVPTLLTAAICIVYDCPATKLPVIVRGEAVTALTVNEIDGDEVAT